MAIETQKEVILRELVNTEGSSSIYAHKTDTFTVTDAFHFFNCYNCYKMEKIKIKMDLGGDLTVEVASRVVSNLLGYWPSFSSVPQAACVTALLCLVAATVLKTSFCNPYDDKM